jgi:hypothetical protein
MHIASAAFVHLRQNMSLKYVILMIEKNYVIRSILYTCEIRTYTLIYTNVLNKSFKLQHFRSKIK